MIKTRKGQAVPEHVEHCEGDVRVPAVGLGVQMKEAQMHTQNPNCDGDHCATSTGTVAILRLPGDSNLHLCRACWAYEMRWRAYRNDGLAEDARYPILKFPGECT